VAIDFTTLTADKTTSGSIKNWVNRSDIPATDILTEAEAYIYQQLRAREMLSTTPLSIAAAASSVALPADFLDPIRFLPYEWGSPLPLTHEAVLYDTRDSSGALFDGTPSQWAIFDGTMTVNSTIPTGETFSGILTYYAQPTALKTGLHSSAKKRSRRPPCSRLIRQMRCGAVGSNTRLRSGYG
jgi:hypothetical protein